MADTVQLSPPVLSGDRIGPVEVAPARPAVTNDTLLEAGTDDRLQFTRQTRAPFLQRYFEENTSGAPLDITSGIASYDRYQLGRHRTEDDQRRYLESRDYSNIRKATDGQWIVRAQGANGPVDLVADPLGIDAGDFAELGASAPQLAWSFATMAATRGLGSFGKAKGILGAARDIVSGTVGGQAAGAIEDIANRVREGAPVDIPEIAKSRAVSGAIDTVIGSAIGTGLAASRFRRNPWIRDRTDIQLDALRAQREVADKYGIHIALTPAEATGSRMLAIEQARLELVPGAADVLKKSRAETQTGPMNLFREVMLGGRVPDSDVVGRQAINALQMTTGATDATVDAARINLSKAALFELEGTAATHSLAERNIEQGFVGDALRNRFTALNDEAHSVNRGLFNRVRELGGDQPVLPGDNLAAAMKKLRGGLPRRFRNKDEASADVLGAEWERGFAVESADELEQMAHAQRTTSGQPVSIAFVPGGIRNMVGELEDGAGNSWKLTELQQMRRRVYDDIGKANALPDTDTHYLSDIGKAITTAMNEGVEALPDGALRDAWRAANKDYVDNVLPFGKRGIAEMFIKDNESGWIGSAQLSSHYTGGAAAADKWRVVKEFIGSDSLEGRAVKRMAFDHVIGGSMEPGGQLLNAKEVLRRLASFKESSPDLYKEMFGKAADDLQRVAKFAIAGEKDMLPAHEIETILRSGKGPTVTALRALKEAEEKQSILYTEETMKGARETGQWDTSKIIPHEFVNRFAFNPKVGAEEIVKVMHRIETSGPGGIDLAGDIRSSALEKFLNRNSAVADLGEVMKKAETDKTMRALLGDDIFSDLHRYGALNKAIVTTREKSMAGAFEATTTMNLLLKLPLRFLQKVGVNNISARVLTSDTLRNWTLRQPEKSELVTMLMLSSPEFLKSVSRSFGNDSEGIRQAESYLGQARRALSESWSQSQGAESRQPTTTNAPTRLSPPTLMLR